MIKAAIITVSDRCSRGQREDLTGEALRVLLEEDGFHVAEKVIVPDERDEIVRKLIEFSDVKGYELIVTNGGTGVSPRDVTPDATREVIEREVPGMAEAMRMESFRITPHALISRAVVGIRKQSLIVNLPGSPKGAKENYQVIRKAIPHALEKIRGSTEECAPPGS
ncbi:MogA/MoaB family molybdenum cofactor biosynthesis protein [Thermodesulforhabdus norvegica]|nr:MogA/MoaB family molybdenum cofactor biosynthesis protein [Thermodesulforhabdus norvegica]